MSDAFLVQAFIYLAAAVIAVPVAQRLGLGSVLGYLVAGMVIGPVGAEPRRPEARTCMHFAEFGVVLMLFLVGLELQPSRLWALRRPIFGLGGAAGASSPALALGGARLAVGFGWRRRWPRASSSPCRRPRSCCRASTNAACCKTTAGQSCFSVLLFQDIAVIPILALLPLLAAAAARHDGA